MDSLSPRISYRALPAVLALALSACASTGDYPSLARRDVERIGGTAQPVPGPVAPNPPAPASAELSARLAGLVDQARSAHTRFAARRARAEQLASAGRGAAMGSESWSVATVAVSSLEAARSEAMIALAELDRLHASDRLTHFNEPSGDAAAIDAARDQVMGWIGEEDSVLAALRGRIAG